MSGRRAWLAPFVLLVATSLVGIPAAAATESTPPSTLSQAGTIRADLNARLKLGSPVRLTITEATSMEPVSWFTLLSEDLLELRYVPAENGVWYAICPPGTRCPYPPRRRSRAVADPLPRLLALELALRTLLETDAPVVSVSLPTPRFVAVVIERVELERQVDLQSLARALRGEPLLDPSASFARLVEELTRPRTYLFLGLEPGPDGRAAWAGLPRWPLLHP